MLTVSLASSLYSDGNNTSVVLEAVASCSLTASSFEQYITVIPAAAAAGAVSRTSP